MMRRKGREIALRLLYQREVTGTSLEEVIKNYQEHFEKPPEPAFDFARELVEGVLKHREEIDAIIQKYTPSWPLERQNLTDRNILRLAVYEMFYRPDIPEVVSINEAVELAKLYGTDDSPAFINGVLDSIYKREIKSRKKGVAKKDEQSDNNN